MNEGMVLLAVVIMLACIGLLIFVGLLIYGLYLSHVNPDWDTYEGEKKEQS